MLPMHSLSCSLPYQRLSPHHHHPVLANTTKLWPAQQRFVAHQHQRTTRLRNCTAADAAQPRRTPPSADQPGDDSKQQQQGQQPPPASRVAAPAEATSPNAQQPTPQQQQQQHQQSSASGSSSRPASSSSSSSKSRPATSTTKSPRKQQQHHQQRPFFLFAWIQTAVVLLSRTPRTLIAFLLGGVGAAMLLYSWALGSPLKRSHPYRFTMFFNEASKVDVGTPIRMKGVQIGNVANVALHASHVEATAEVADATNIIPQGSRVDINLLGLAADPWIDITPPGNPVVRKDHGPHHHACASDGLIVCHNGSIRGQLGGSTDFMMKFFLSQHDRTRVKVVDAVYHGKHV